jgi:glycosyltransferase involved in cell wall biosynthesis
VLLVSNRDVTVKPFLYGEDYYISTIVSELEKCGIPVDFAIFHGKKSESRGRNAAINIEEIVDDCTVVILHNVSPFHVCKAKMKKKGIRVVIPIYFIWNRVSALCDNLRTSIGPLFWQFVVDEYIVPSRSLAERLRKLGIIKKITILPPEYSCPYCNRMDNLKKRVHLKEHLPRIVNAVYIGSIIPKRIPLARIVDMLNEDPQREYKLTVYTASEIKEQTYQKGNVEIAIVKKSLSDEEKCKILRESHIFIAPTRGATMEPSISIMEAEYHGNIIIKIN